MPSTGSSGESLAGGYGRWVIDLERGWPTERLDLEPLAVAHAAELAPLLDDAALHEFTGGAPLSAAVLAARYARLAARRSPGGDQLWAPPGWLSQPGNSGGPPQPNGERAPSAATPPLPDRFL